MNATDVKKNDNIIQFDHVTFQYNKEEGKPIQVLKDISLEIQAGSFVAVLGHNGCADVLRMLAGCGLQKERQSLVSHFCVHAVLFLPPPH